ncbi:uncharacterized protein CC84DRAFT_959864 [Paraphaeosphaeria sporulosa]|uniref:Uncharacterized protein n=1 Tax=Paraphaeosphaeria sporulosa TaxID=1460663 RepID=A0A177C677_9PLEO|nr:uncharacterized protein CC84DRAFT_959864 [Paraphaeosphaeria sporulosa]OAG03133.1 hypothetical protein CC84DRAFT_959864 [Paraphaeosphaeria sporulosa]
MDENECRCFVSRARRGFLLGARLASAGWASGERLTRPQASLWSVFWGASFELWDACVACRMLVPCSGCAVACLSCLSMAEKHVSAWGARRMRRWSGQLSGASAKCAPRVKGNASIKPWPPSRAFVTHICCRFCAPSPLQRALRPPKSPVSRIGVHCPRFACAARRFKVPQPVATQAEGKKGTSRLFRPKLPACHGSG